MLGQRILSMFLKTNKPTSILTRYNSGLKSTVGCRTSKISLTNINQNDKKGLFAVEIDKGSLSHADLGTANIKAYFFLYLKPGQYVLPGKEVFDASDKFMMDWAFSRNLIEPESRPAITFSKRPSNLTIYLVPELKPYTKEWEIYLKVSVLYWGLDDFIDDEVAKGKLNPEDLEQLALSIEGILQGKYLSINSVKKHRINFFNSVLVCMFELYLDFVSLVKDYNENCGPFVVGIVDWIRSINFFAGIKGSNWISDYAYTQIRLESGQKVMYESWCLIKQTFVSETIRETLPFKLFFSCGNWVANLSNDIFSLEKELKNGEFSCNMVTRKALHERIPLQDAIEVVQDMSNDCVLDMLSAAEILRNEYPGNVAVQTYVDNYLRFCDGCYYLYISNSERYGACEWSVKKVVMG